MRPLVIYHANCTDGFSAAWCFWRKFRDNADYMPGVYQEAPPDVTDRNVYLVDFSYPRAVVEEMLNTAQSVTLIDHHKSALEDLAELPYLNQFTDLDRSGATLAWDFLFPDEKRPQLLDRVADRDLWRFQLPNTREIMACLFSFEHDFDVWDVLMAGGEEDLQGMVTVGAAIERKQLKDVTSMIETCRRRLTIAGYNVPVASLPPMMASDAGQVMAEGEPFAACYWDTAEHRVFSLRANTEGLDVADIAKQFGGGGHAKASGFKVPRDHELALA